MLLTLSPAINWLRHLFANDAGERLRARRGLAISSSCWFAKLVSSLPFRSDTQADCHRRCSSGVCMTNPMRQFAAVDATSLPTDTQVPLGPAKAATRPGLIGEDTA